jgi:hypothetical protein
VQPIWLTVVRRELPTARSDSALTTRWRGNAPKIGARWGGVGWLLGFTAKRRARRSEPRQLPHAGMTVWVWRPWWQRREGKSALRSPLLGEMGSMRLGRHAHWGHIRTCASGAGVACASNGQLANSGAGAGHGRDIEETWAAAVSLHVTWGEKRKRGRAGQRLAAAGHDQAKRTQPDQPDSAARRMAQGGPRQ